MESAFSKRATNIKRENRICHSEIIDPIKPELSHQVQIGPTMGPANSSRYKPNPKYNPSLQNLKKSNLKDRTTERGRTHQIHSKKSWPWLRFKPPPTKEWPRSKRVRFYKRSNSTFRKWKATLKRRLAQHNQNFSHEQLLHDYLVYSNLCFVTSTGVVFYDCLGKNWRIPSRWMDSEAIFLTIVGVVLAVIMLTTLLAGWYDDRAKA